MFDSLLEAYTSPLFFYLPVLTTLVSMGAFLLLATPYTLLSWVNPPSLRPYRIQDKTHDADYVFWPSVWMWVQNNLVMLGLVVFGWPLLYGMNVHMGAVPPWYIIVPKFFLFVFWDDFLYYWMHRAMHSKLLYKRVHAVHHRMHAPWAISAHYMHPVEFVLTGTLALSGPLIFGAHIYEVWLYIGFRQFIAADGHAGWDFPWNPMRLFPFYNGPGYHDYHHAKFRGNYSGFLEYLDGVFGTYARGYEDYRWGEAESASKSSVSA